MRESSAWGVYISILAGEFICVWLGVILNLTELIFIITEQNEKAKAFYKSRSFPLSWLWWHNSRWVHNMKCYSKLDYFPVQSWRIKLCRTCFKVLRWIILHVVEKLFLVPPYFQLHDLCMHNCVLCCICTAYDCKVDTETFACSKSRYSRSNKTNMFHVDWWVLLIDHQNRFCPSATLKSYSVRSTLLQSWGPVFCLSWKYPLIEHRTNQRTGEGGPPPRLVNLADLIRNVLPHRFGGIWQPRHSGCCVWYFWFGKLQQREDREWRVLTANQGQNGT